MKIFLVLFFGTIMCSLSVLSWYRNVELFKKRVKNKDFTSSDKFIDYPLRVVWLLYISIFSIGFIVNNF